MKKAKGSTAEKVRGWTRFKLNAIIVGQGNWWAKKHELEELTDSKLQNLQFDVAAFHMFFLCLVSKINKDLRQTGKLAVGKDKVKTFSARKTRLQAMAGILKERTDQEREEEAKQNINKVKLKTQPAKHKNGTS